MPDINEDAIRTDYVEAREELDDIQEEQRELRMETQVLERRIETQRGHRRRLENAEAEDIIGVDEDAPDQEVDEVRREHIEEVRQTCFELEEELEEKQDRLDELGDREEDLVFECNQAENMADRYGFELPRYDGDDEDEDDDNS